MFWLAVIASFLCGALQPYRAVSLLLTGGVLSAILVAIDIYVARGPGPLYWRERFAFVSVISLFVPVFVLALLIWRCTWRQPEQQ